MGGGAIKAVQRLPQNPLFLQRALFLGRRRRLASALSTCAVSLRAAAFDDERRCEAAARNAGRANWKLTVHRKAGQTPFTCLIRRKERPVLAPPYVLVLSTFWSFLCLSELDCSRLQSGGSINAKARS